MSSYGYRLEQSLTAIAYSPDGRSSLRVLAPETVLLISGGPTPDGMVRVVAGDGEYKVFLQDLEERSTVTIVDQRRPAGLCASTATGQAAVRWAV